MKKSRFSAALGTMLVISALVITTVPAASHTGNRFGAKLDTNTQPTNSFEARPCDNPAQSCTWVMVDAFRRPGTRLHWSRAPRDGVIKKIRLIAGEAGSFRLQIAKVKPGDDLRKAKAKIVRNGPVITVKGQPDGDAPYLIETFKVHVPVKKGQFLAVRAKTLSMLRCNSGGPEILQFQPRLPVGGSFRRTDATSGCNMLLQAILK